MDNDNVTKSILQTIGIEVDNNMGYLIPREHLLSDEKYEEIKHYIPELKKVFSSSFMTSLQKNAEKSQKWPLLNLVRQILNVYGYKMVPLRKADGYSLDGTKRYKRYFSIQKKTNNDADNNKIETEIADNN